MATSWRWLILAAFAVNTGLNSIQFMNFASVPDVSIEALGGTNSTVTEDDINALYSASLFSVLPATLPAMYFLDKRNKIATGVGVFCNVIGVWLRYLAVASQSYSLAVISSILVGFAAAVIICSYTHLSGRWFPPAERTLATSIAVQCNYAGWCIGTLIPLTVTTVDELRNFMLWQAILGTSAIVMFVAFHRDHPADNGYEEYHSNEDPSISNGIEDEYEGEEDENELISSQNTIGNNRSDEHENAVFNPLRTAIVLFSNLQFDLQCLAFAMLGGISFTIPAVQAEIFSDEGFSTDKSCWTNFSFVFSGVITGLTIGAKIKNKTMYPAVLKFMFALCSIALSLLAWLCNAYTIGDGKDIEPSTIYPYFIILMGVAGGTSLGFIGLGLAMASEAAHPIGHEYSGGAVEWFINVIGAILALFATGSTGFTMVAVLCWLVTILTFVGLRDSTQAKAPLSISSEA